MTLKTFLKRFSDQLNSDVDIKDYTKFTAELSRIVYYRLMEEIVASVNSLDEGEDVKLSPYFVFQSVIVPARKSRNPRTGEPLNIPAKKSVRIKKGKKFKATAV